MLHRVFRIPVFESSPIHAHVTLPCFSRLGSDFFSALIGKFGVGGKRTDVGGSDMHPVDNGCETYRYVHIFYSAHKVKIIVLEVLPRCYIIKCVSCFRCVTSVLNLRTRLDITSIIR